MSEDPNHEKPYRASIAGLPAERAIVLGLLAYTVVICLLRMGNWIPARLIHFWVGIPCFVAGIWCGYQYFHSHNVEYDWGLLLAGTGWVCGGMTLVSLRSDGAGAAALTSSAKIWIALAVSLILTGGIVGWLSVQGEKEMQEESSDASPAER